MKNRFTKKLLLFTTLILLLNLFCSQSKPVFLNIQISPLDTLSYHLTYNTGGEFFWGDSSSDLSTTIECNLTGTHIKNNPGKLTVTSKDVTVYSNILDSIEILNTKNSIEFGEFEINFSDDNFTVDKIPNLPLSTSAEHKFARQLLKLAPTLPTIAVRVGFKWERERVFPLETSFGIIPCTLYRTYSFDSLSTETDIAFISWKFKYMIDKGSIDSTSKAFEVPMSGKGSGNSVIDTKKHQINSMEMIFFTDEIETSEMRLRWKEKALMIIKERA